MTYSSASAGQTSPTRQTRSHPAPASPEPSTEAPAHAPPEGRRAWRHNTWLLGLLGAIGLWASFPPLGLGWLGWLAPVPWLLLVRQSRLAGWRPWLAIWLSGFLFWLLSVEWLRHAHPAAAVGAVFLAAYLAWYASAFLWLARTAVHCYRLPLVAAAPLAWLALDLVRGHLLGGFTLGSLAHTQTGWLTLLQICDLCGAYGLSALLVTVAAGAAACLPWEGTPWRWRPLVPGLLLLAASLVYGNARLLAPRSGTYRVALIQGATPTEVKHDPARHEQVWREYYGLSQQAAAARPRPDLMIWPETMFREPLFTYSDDVAPPPDADWTLPVLKSHAQYTRQILADTARSLRCSLLVGLDVIHFGAGTRAIYNSAVLVSADGSVKGRYDKMHPVLFGETIPFAKTWPALYRLLPVPQGIEIGTRHTSFQLGPLTGAANICYECLVPHLLRWQVDELAQRGAEPDLMLNLTNNGYYGGSAELDALLVACQFRAIELRKPFLVAANCGFSAWIDADGRIRSRGRRQQTDVVWAQPAADPRRSLYRRGGDWLPSLALLICGGLALGRIRPRRLRAAA